MSEVMTTRPIEVIEGEILFFKAQAGGAILEIGRRLIEAKSQLQHGEWLPWLAEKVDFSEMTAQRFMKLARECENTPALLDLGATKALALLALPESEREEFVSEKHEVRGEEKTVQEMSTRELDEAIRARKQAEEELAKAKQEKLDAEIRADNFAKEAEKARADADAAQASGKKRAEDKRVLKATLKDQKAQNEQRSAEADELRRELEELKDKPVEVAVQEPSEEQIAAAAAPMVEAARAESAERIRELEKLLALADPETQAFKMRFVVWQEAYEEMAKVLEKIEKADPEKAAKLSGAVKAAVERMK